MRSIAFLVAAILLLKAEAQETWTPLQSDTGSSLMSCWFLSADTGFAVGFDGTILKTMDGGASWSLRDGLTNLRAFRSVYFRTPDTGWIAGDWALGIQSEAYLLRTHDQGETWTRVPNGIQHSLFSIRFTSDSVGYVVGTSGGYAKTVDGGVNWTATDLTPGAALRALAFTAPDTGYIVGDSGIILKTTDAGTNWARMNSGTANILLGLNFPTASTGYASGQNGTVLKTTDAGSNWTNVSPGTAAIFYALDFLDADTGFLAGAGGVLYKTIDGGANWTTQASGIANNLYSFSFPNSDTGYLVGSGGTMTKYTRNPPLVILGPAPSFRLLRTPTTRGLWFPDPSGTRWRDLRGRVPVPVSAR